MRRLLIHPMFLGGLAVRIFLVVYVQAVAVSQWYAPFLDVSTSGVTLDPWLSWLDQGGDPAAFPYGYVMWLAFLPATLMLKVLAVPLSYGYGLTVLAADFGLLLALRLLVPGRDQLLLAVYWLSPIVLVASYVLGLNDVIPVLLLVLAMHLARERRFLPAGILCVAAVSAKLSMVVALPFFAVYLIRNRGLRRFLPGFVKGLAIGVLLFLLPFAVSQSGLYMLFSNPEMDKVYRLTLQIGSSIVVYLVPLVYLLLLYSAWHVRRLNFDLFQSFLGVAFLVLVLLTPASPGWFVWALPLLVTYQAQSGRVAIALSALFSTIYVLSLLVADPPVLYAGQGVLGLDIGAPDSFGTHAGSLLHTLMMAIGVILIVRLWRENIRLNDFFRLSRRPFVVGIAGDTGSGKSTLVDAMTGLFGVHSVTTLSGADYQLWDHRKPMWQVMTHLNPRANDLEGYATDLVSLIDGKAVTSRRADQRSVRPAKSQKIRSNDFIIASGAHALYLPILRSCLNVSIYLDMEEGLRRHFVEQREGLTGASADTQVKASIARRDSDAARFVRPQAEYADLVFSLQPIHPRMLEDADEKHPLRFKLIARSRHGLHEASLARILIGVCGLHVDMVVRNESDEVELTIEGETSAADIAMAAGLLCPQVIQFLDVEPEWKDGMVGLMQLIALSHISQALTKRFL